VAKAEAFTPSMHVVKQGNGEQAFVTARSVFFAGKRYDTSIYSREKLRPGDTLTGPAIISEYSSATIVPPGDLLRVDALENLIIEVQG
jgi:N-methylhydantoinase A